MRTDRCFALLIYSAFLLRDRDVTVVTS